MASSRQSHRLTTSCVALMLVCLLIHVLLTDCGPIRKKKTRSKSVSATTSLATRDPTANQSSNVDTNVNADHLQDNKADKDVVQFHQVNLAEKRVPADHAGKQVPADHGNDAVNDDVAAGNGPVPGVPAPHQPAVDGGEKVGQLPVVRSMPDSSKVNTSVDTTPKSVVGADEKQREEQGLAVGVGGMNRMVSTATTTTPGPVFNDGQDDSLYVGAADRVGSPEGRPKAQSQNGAADDNPSDADKTRGGDGYHANPALQQPPPQAREPPDQFRDKKIQFGPVRPDRDAPVLVPPGQQPAPMGRDEIQLKETLEQPAVVGEAGLDEEQPKEHPLKFKQKKKNEVVNEKQSEKLDDINPPDHMEGFRLERDGHLNRDYKKEIFLGHHEEFEWSDEEKVSGKLKVIFRRVDTNSDSFIDAKEIEVWIMKNVKVHLDDSVKDNAKVFKHLDADKDGLVSWFEFFSHFLVAKGYVHSAKNVPKNESAIKLETDDNERILKYRYRWVDADEDPKDEKLDINEMLNFRHPEQSKLSIERLITDFIDSVDKDADGIITEEEFIALPHDLGGENPLPLEEEWQEERKKEFRNVIDINKDGKADEKELKTYFDPHNVNHAKLEADNLIRMADTNDDGKLSVEEVLDNTELFLVSKMVDARRKLHDEF